MTVTYIEKVQKFLARHHSGELLVLPNAWDVASARLIEDAGFSALATTSAGVGYALGYPDLHCLSREQMMAAVKPMIDAVAVPVTVDVENGYGDTPEDVGETVRQLIAIGAVGCNIEDIDSYGEGTLVDAGFVADRIRAAREAADGEGVDLVINARTDGYLAGGSGPSVFSDAVARGNAYLEAGARCVFVPGLGVENDIANMVRELNGPLNLVSFSGLASLDKLQELGVARVSTGSSLARAAYGGLKGALQELKTTGTYTYAENAVSSDDMDELYK